MSSLTLVRRGTISATSADGAGPKDSSAFAAVKTGSSFLVARIRERRKGVFVQQGTIAITDADSGGTKDSSAFTAVDLACSYVIAQLREKRTDDHRGATVKLQTTTTVRATFNPPAAGDLIDVDFQIVEHKPRFGATVHLADTTHARLTWDGTLTAGETIDVTFDVFDMDDVGDSLLELDFKLLRLLGYDGENSLVDLHQNNQAGNTTQFRVRIFDSAANLNDATKDLPEGEDLEEGELSRELVTIEWDPETNRRKAIWREQTEIASTPGIS